MREEENIKNDIYDESYYTNENNNNYYQGNIEEANFEYNILENKLKNERKKNMLLNNKLII